MSLSNVKHQPRAQSVIRRAIAGGRIPHAYIFHGPDGVGKESFARSLAQLLLCANARTSETAGTSTRAGEDDVVPSTYEPQAPANDLFPNEPDSRSPQTEPRPSGSGLSSNDPISPCGRCDDCRMIAADTHPDWHLVYRQLNRVHPDPEVRRRKGLDIGVDVLRHFVIDKVGFTPSRGRAKVFVVREADRITTQAQNALLKTLEEPPGTTYLVLLVTSIDRLLPTTLSRCQVVEFDPLPGEFVRERLRAAFPNLAAPQLPWCAWFADGSIGAGIQAVEEHLFDVYARVRGTLLPQSGTTVSGAGASHRALLMAYRSRCLKAWSDEAEALGELYRKRDPDISDTEATRRGWKTVFRLLAETYANLLRLASERESKNPSAQSVNAAAAQANGADPEPVADAIQRIALAERHLDLNANTQLVVETLANDLARIQTSDPIVAE